MHVRSFAAFLLLLPACGGEPADTGLTVGMSGSGATSASTSTSTGAETTVGSETDGPTTASDPTTDETTAVAPTTTEATSTSTGPGPSDMCGNGIVEGEEECDLGAANADDAACTADCELAACGDGLVRDDVEQCDDGNLAPGDGCDPECQFESQGEDAEVVLEGLALTIPSDLYDGSQSSMACVDLAIAKVGVVHDVRMKIGADHPHVGDLVFKLWSPKGTVLTLLSLPGGAEAADDGMSDSTENSDIDPVWPVTFRNDGTDAELMGHTIGIDQAVCRDDGVCEYAPSPGAGPGEDFGDFVGEPSEGTWRFCAGDSAFADKGTLESVTLTVVVG
jgi:cysteine-rich repeat protein